MQLSINHPDYSTAERTILTDPVSLGYTTLKVKSIKQYTASDYIIVGEIATENAEMRAIASVVDDISMTVDALDFSHSEGDPIIYSLYNKIRVYRADSLTGTYTVIATIDIDVDQDFTVYNDTTGTSGQYYKIDYYNSTSTASSSLSDPIPATGVENNTVRYVTDQVLKEARDEQEAVTNRDEILGWMNDCQADVKARRRKWAFLYTRSVAATIADREYYDIDTAWNVTDIDKIDHILYHLDDGTSDKMYRLMYVPEEEFDYLSQDNDAESSDTVEKFTYDGAMSYIRIYPKPATAISDAMYLYYYKDIPYLDSDGDELIIPDTRVYKFYCLHQFHLKKGDLNLANMYSAKYEQAVVGLMRGQRKEVSQPRGFRYLPKRERRFYNL